MAGVTEGEEPTVNRSNQAPRGMSRPRTGQASGYSASTFRPPPSHTTTTMSLGGPVRSSGGRSASVIGRPSGAVKSKSRNRAIVGATSAMVAGWETTPTGGTNPGPYQSIGTRWRYSHGPEWGNPFPMKLGAFGVTWISPDRPG